MHLALLPPSFTRQLPVPGCVNCCCPAVNCILQWALCKEWCPQCKKPFDYLLCHKQLDGTLSDFLVEESVVLLKRARWFDDHMRVSMQREKIMQRCPVGQGGGH
jgi:hypothetical protein